MAVTTTHPIPVLAPRVAAAAGIGSAVILAVNAAKRATLLPTTDLTQLVAPLAEVLAILLMIGIFAASHTRNRWMTAALAVNVAALAALVGVEFVINLVFAQLAGPEIAALRAGPLGVALTVASLSFLVGSLLFVGVLLRNRELPPAALVLYGVAAVPVALRALVPEWVLDVGLAGLAVAVGWLAVWLWRAA